MVSSSALRRQLEKVKQSLGVRGFRSAYRLYINAGILPADRETKAAVIDLAGVVEEMESLERNFARSTRDADWEGVIDKHKAPASHTERWYPLFRHKEQSRLDTWSKLLFDQALVAEGSLPGDPANFARAITSLMQKAVEYTSSG